MSTPGSAAEATQNVKKCPCPTGWTAKFHEIKTPTSDIEDFTPQSPGVAFGQYSTAYEAITVSYSTPGFTPYFMRNFLTIGPLTPKTPKTPETPKTPSDSKLYEKYYYWYWLLDPLFCTYGEEGGRENELLDLIRLDAMNIAYGILDKKLKSYEDRAQREPVININREFIDEVFTKLQTEKPKYPKYIIDQIKNSCQYRAATGTILPSDIVDHCNTQTNEEEDGEGSPRVSDGGSTRRRRRPIKPSKKRSTVRRRRGRRSSKRKARTTRRHK